MAKESFGIVPMADLDGSERSKGQNDGNASGSRRDQRPAKIGSQIPGSPNDADEEANVRNVGVAISVSLFTDLDQTNNRHERAQIPEPANNDPRRATKECECKPRDNNQEERGADYLPVWPGP